jgi:hypothetical protein
MGWVWLTNQVISPWWVNWHGINRRSQLLDLRRKQSALETKLVKSSVLLHEGIFHFSDIDECLTGKYKCGDGEECHNKENGYECRCTKGLTREKSKCIGMSLFITSTIHILCRIHIVLYSVMFSQIQIKNLDLVLFDPFWTSTKKILDRPNR